MFPLFLFDCIFEWSKIKANCPLCKQQFNLIFYDIKKIDDYKEFKIKTSSASILSSQYTVFSDKHLMSALIVKRFRLNVYKLQLFVSPNEIEVLDTIQNQTKKESTSIVVDRTTSIIKPTRYRDINAAFYSNNDACTHRLMPFITREIDALKKHFRVQQKHILTKELMFIIIGLVKKYDINSKQFLSAIQNYIKLNSIAIHFLHELITYARSITKSLAEYDAKCVYYTLNFTERVDMILYRKYENANIVSTHVCTLPPKLTGAVDEILKSFEETIEVIKIDDDDDEIDNDIEMCMLNGRMVMMFLLYRRRRLRL
jgi:E3 ubiquitin-protein ligase Topors